MEIAAVHYNNDTYVLTVSVSAVTPALASKSLSSSSSNLLSALPPPPTRIVSKPRRSLSPTSSSSGTGASSPTPTLRSSAPHLSLAPSQFLHADIVSPRRKENFLSRERARASEHESESESQQKQQEQQPQKQQQQQQQTQILPAIPVRPTTASSSSPQTTPRSSNSCVGDVANCSGSPPITPRCLSASTTTASSTDLTSSNSEKKFVSTPTFKSHLMSEIAEIIDSLLQVFYVSEKHAVKVTIPFLITKLVDNKITRQEVTFDYDEIVKSTRIFFCVEIASYSPLCRGPRRRGDRARRTKGFGLGVSPRHRHNL